MRAKFQPLPAPPPGLTGTAKRVKQDPDGMIDYSGIHSELVISLV